ncbi:MAG: DUF3500 domain-containing protein [Labilithrix sp.]
MGIGAAAFFACSDGDSGSSTGASSSGGTGVQTSSGTTSSSSTTSSSGATVTGNCSYDTSAEENRAAVVAAANALLATLTTEQKTAIRYEKTLANAAQWSNFPTTFVQRNGVRMGDMSAEAQAAAVALAAVAAGDVGARLLAELRAADQYLTTIGGSSTDYGDGLYYVSIHGTPSMTSAWMLQIAGHHLAYNFTYGGRCTSATPLFDGVEPTSWTDAAGAHAPLEAQRASVVALLASIGGNADAKLSGTFSDLVNGPAGGGPGGGSGGDTKYPSSLAYPTSTTGRGVLVSSLSAEQQVLVKTTIEAWVKNVADPVSASILAAYESDEALAQTYVAYSGSADMSTQASYYRVDGPRVWIEFSAQGGVIVKDKVHFHTVWRDKVSDYGADYISL